MLTNTNTTSHANTQTRFHACAPAAIGARIKKSKEIAKDKTGNAALIDLLRKRAAKTQGTRRAITLPLMKVLEKAGRLLDRDGGDNYALALVTAAELNQVYLAEQSGDDRYRKYFPRSKKTGKIKEIRFTSEHFCQTEMADHVPVYETENGAVRAKIHTCGKAWTCPICAAKIAVRRNEEIHIILSKARAEGMTTYMITLTAPHYYHQRLLYASERMQKAYAHFDNSGDMKKLRKKYKVFGKIKTMETMVGGENGWNNHFHIVYIFECKIDACDELIILEAIKKQWEKSCIKAGILDRTDKKQISDFRDYAVDLKRDFDPDYIAKQSAEWKKEYRANEEWGSAEELTFSHIKKGEGSCTPFGHVALSARRAAAGCYTIAEMERDTELFVEFACAMKGRSMIQFSKGLRKWAGLESKKSDKKICNEQKDKGTLIGGFDKAQHTFIRSHALWSPFKKLLAKDQKVAIETISEIFVENGLRPFYTVAEMETMIFDGGCVNLYASKNAKAVGD